MLETEPSILFNIIIIIIIIIYTIAGEGNCFSSVLWISLSHLASERKIKRKQR